DLQRFRPQPYSPELPLADLPLDPRRFRVLFATAPNSFDGLRERGVDLMMAAARQLPDVDFFLLWRPWADADTLIDHCRAQAPPNVHISNQLVPDMTQMFRATHATIAPFRHKI